jgi:hypothetical protein
MLVIIEGNRQPILKTSGAATISVKRGLYSPSRHRNTAKANANGASGTAESSHFANTTNKQTSIFSDKAQLRLKGQLEFSYTIIVLGVAFTCGWRIVHASCQL